MQYSVLIDPKFSHVISTVEKTVEKGNEQNYLEQRDDDGGEGEEEREERRSTLLLSSMLRRKMKKITRARGLSSSSSESGRAAKEDQSPLMGMLRLSNIQAEDDGRILPRVTQSIEDSSVLPFEHVSKHFPLSCASVLADPHLSRVLSNASFLIGVHPDQVTEAIVDIAIHLRIPFAIVPCCVFTKLFSSRKTPAGGAVRTYEELVVYLKGKHPNITRGVLPFYGRNIVLYCASYD